MSWTMPWRCRLRLGLVLFDMVKRVLTLTEAAVVPWRARAAAWLARCAGCWMSVECLTENCASDFVTAGDDRSGRWLRNGVAMRAACDGC